MATDGSSRSAPLPPALVARLEESSGLKFVATRPRAGGGASRDGAEVDLRDAEGAHIAAYLTFDARRLDDPMRTLNFRREASILTALSGRLNGYGVAVPKVLATDESHLALLCERVQGESNFNKLTDGPARLSVGVDFMRQLARLHALDASTLNLDGFSPPEHAWNDALQRVSARRAAAAANGADPQITFALGWLERHPLPPPDRIVLLHGDCGPGNFIYEDGRVAANLDWELTRYGDPMEDLAMLCIRNLIQSFIPLPQAFAAYREAGGADIDLNRLRYHRLSNQLGFMAPSRTTREPAPEPPVLGMSLVFQTMHMRIMIEQLAELAHVDLPPVPLPDALPGVWSRTYEGALKDLRDVIVPHATDQLAVEKGKGLARLVKFWRGRERFGAVFDAEEVNDISRALGQRYTNLAEARAALRDAVSEGAVDDTTCIHLFHRRAVRETAIMADAMGTLARTQFAALED